MQVSTTFCLQVVSEAILFIYLSTYFIASLDFITIFYYISIWVICVCVYMCVCVCVCVCARM